MRRFQALASVLAVLAFGPMALAASQDTAPVVPAGAKVVLVLSGGGARGAAHVGVLKALEELHVPVHSIVGTSMGAVVGGLYASGLSPAMLERIIVQMNWGAVLIDDPSREAFRFRRKLQDSNLLVRGGSGLGTQGIKLPQGFMHGHQLKAWLTRQTLHVADVEQFRDLPIPFVAVAADLGTGEAVLLDRGNLPEAMLASMAIPAFVSPVEHDGRLLVDGGVANNLPVDVALTMSPDLIIAVDASSPLRNPEELPSLLEITEQLTSILTRNNTRPQIELLRAQDLLLIPDLGDIGSAEFNRAPEAIAAGYQAAQPRGPELAAAAGEDDTDFEVYLAHQRRQQVEKIRVETIEVRSNSPIDSDRLAARLKLSPGQVSVGDVEQAMDRLYGMEVFSQVPYRYRRGRLEVNPVRKPWGPNYLQFGIGLEDDFQGRNHYRLGLAFTATELNRTGAEWRTEGYVGERPALITEWYQPLGRTGTWFVDPSLSWSGFNRGSFDRDVLVTEYQIRQIGIDVGVGRTFSTEAEARLQLSWADGVRERLVGDPSIRSVGADRGAATLSLRYDTLDNLYFPTRGRRAEFSLVWSDTGLGAEADYRSAQALYSQAFSHGRHSVVASAEYATVYDGTAPFHEAYTLGGFFNLSGLQVDRKLGQHRGLGRLAYYYRLQDGRVLPVYLGASLEAGEIWQDETAVSLPALDLAGSLFVGLDSPIGPLYLAMGFAQGGERTLYVFLGQPF